ncbi:MAG: PDZ domain-containing protein, partial [Candidatus Cloacimonetes bacterium]|nr:PDZ domain-containing protein [Candidatus Cloacimonadota bacterium]
AKAGIKAGDVVLSIERQNLKTVSDYDRIIEKAAKENRKSVLAHIVSRDGIYRFIPINIE